MKKKLILLVALLVPVFASAQNIKETYPPFYDRSVAPHLEKVLPGPPALTDPRFSDDWNKYLWGKSIRDTERGKVAIEDAFLGATYFFKRFSAPCQRELTKEKYPILYNLIYRAHMTEMEAGASAKAYFHRVRPYQQFKEPTAVPNSENQNDHSSYPSGHTHASWLVGLILTSLDPDHTADIMKVAYDMGESRVIVGFHYESDIEAGRYAASITFARLMADPEFVKELNKAKKEFQANAK